MEPGEYDALVARAQTNNTSAIDLLQCMRTHKIRQPELVLQHGGRLLGSCQRKLGTDVWTILEQVFIAAVEMGATQWQDYCLNKLTTKFPNSVRVSRLKGIRFESLEKWDEAKKVYNKIIEDTPEETISRKRLIAMHKQRGKVSEAIDEINKYLETFSVDAEVWHELAEIYVEAGSLSRATFCFEELVMSNPRSMYHILTYAELLYSTGVETSSAGDIERLELSRKYFSLAAYLDGTCLRALWGLWAANLALAEKEKNKEKMEDLQVQGIKRLQAAYKSVGSHGELAITMLNSMPTTAA